MRKNIWLGIMFITGLLVGISGTNFLKRMIAGDTGRTISEGFTEPEKIVLEKK